MWKITPLLRIMSNKNLLLRWWQKHSRLKARKRKINTPTLSQIHYSFKNPALLLQALTHKSYAKELDHEDHNERLEFLGDAVLEICVSDLLMKEHPIADEGDLSKMRAALVNTTDLAKLALDLKLDQAIKLGISEQRDKVKLKPRLLAGLIEAILGAIYLDGGFSKVYKVVKTIMGQSIKAGPINKDYKSVLQEFVQKKFRKTLDYPVISVKRWRRQKTFTIHILMEKKLIGRGQGSSKKQAAQSAALSALKYLRLAPYKNMKD